LKLSRGSRIKYPDCNLHERNSLKFWQSASVGLVSATPKMHVKRTLRLPQTFIYRMIFLKLKSHYWLEFFFILAYIQMLHPISWKPKNIFYFRERSRSEETTTRTLGKSQVSWK